MKKILNITSIIIMRYSIVFLLTWFGCQKFLDDANFSTSVIEYVKHSFTLKWLFFFFSDSATLKVIGFFEICTGILIGLHPLSSKVGNIGCIFGMIIFLNTISFLFTTPNSFEVIQGMLISADNKTGFILKDFVLLGFCLFSLSTDQKGKATSKLNDKKK